MNHILDLNQFKARYINFYNRNIYGKNLIAFDPYALITFVKDWCGFCKSYYYDIMILFRMSLHYELRFSVTSRIRIRPILLYNALINNYWMRLSMIS